MIFGPRQDQHFAFNLVGHKIDICTDFKYLGGTFSTSVKPRNIMLGNSGRQCMYFLNEFKILVFQLICSYIYFFHVILRVELYGRELWDLEISKTIEINIMISSERERDCCFEKSIPIYMLHA